MVAPRSSTRSVRRRARRLTGVTAAVVALVAPLALAACGGSDEGSASAGAAPAPAAPAGSAVLASATDVAALLENPPAELTILDIRTPEEFAGGHLEGAIMIDFYEPTFLDDVAELDRDAPLLVYCRSGNRSAQAVAAMVSMGFTDIVELDGGVISWAGAGLPFVTS